MASTSTGPTCFPRLPDWTFYRLPEEEVRVVRHDYFPVIHTGFKAHDGSCLFNNPLLQGDRRMTARGLISNWETVPCHFCFLPRPGTTLTRHQLSGGMP